MCDGILYDGFRIMKREKSLQDVHIPDGKKCQFEESLNARFNIVFSRECFFFFFHVNMAFQVSISLVFFTIVYKHMLIFTSHLELENDRHSRNQCYAGKKIMIIKGRKREYLLLLYFSAVKSSLDRVLCSPSSSCLIV